jgi:hypothetical protein
MDEFKKSQYQNKMNVNNHQFPRDNRSLRDSEATHTQLIEKGQCAKIK